MRGKGASNDPKRGFVMGQAETFEHTADLGLRVVAKDLPDLFESAAAGLFDAIVANRSDVLARESESVSVTAETVPDLFLAWLNELIFRSETRHCLYSEFHVQVDASGHDLQATIAGEPIDRDRHILDHEVKAATHHGLTVRRVDDGWLAEVILDI
jgi:SHS2 domain-containing protein